MTILSRECFFWQKKKSPLTGAFFRVLLYTLYFCGFFPFWGLSNLELDPITLLKGTVTFTDDIAVVRKHITTAVFFLDEAKSFPTIEPLYVSVNHISPFKSLFIEGIENMNILHVHQQTERLGEIIPKGQALSIDQQELHISDYLDQLDIKGQVFAGQRVVSVERDL